MNAVRVYEPCFNQAFPSSPSVSQIKNAARIVADLAV